VDKQFQPGEKAYLRVSTAAMEVKVEYKICGRYVVSYSGITNGPIGMISVNPKRLYRTHEEAMRSVNVPPVQKTVIPQKQYLAPFRADEPGDGWGRRN